MSVTILAHLHRAGHAVPGAAWGSLGWPPVAVAGVLAEPPGLGPSYRRGRVATMMCRRLSLPYPVVAGVPAQVVNGLRLPPRGGGAA